MLQIILTIILYLIMVIPVGIYVYHIAAGKHTFADPVFDRVDGVIYKISGIKPKNGMNWKKLFCEFKVSLFSIPTESAVWRNPFPSIRSSVS